MNTAEDEEEKSRNFYASKTNNHEANINIRKYIFRN